MRVLCGTDATTISRIARAVERGGERFVQRVFTPEETAFCDAGGKGRDAALAARFAAKEAVAKALGTGMAGGVAVRDIEIVRTSSGAPEVLLHKGARERYESLGGTSLSISLTHEGDLAIAMCVILCEGPPEPQGGHGA